MAQPTKRICIRAPQTIISDLNDDVLCEVLGHMDIEHMIVMADVCSTFRRIVRQVFSRRYKSVEFVDTVKMRSAWFGHIERSQMLTFLQTQCKQAVVARSHWIPLLQKFGNLIQSIDATKSARQTPLKAIAQYCGESLKGILLKKSEITNDMILDWRPLLSGLRTLSLNECEFSSDSDLSQMLWFCVELDWLSLRCMSPKTIEAPVALPKLMTLKWWGYANPGTNVAMEQLIALNPQLKEISYSPLTRGMIRLIGKFVPNIEKLDFTYDGREIEDWGEFKNLKWVRIKGVEFYDHQDTRAFPLKARAGVVIPVEELILDNISSTGICTEVIAKLKHLRKLSLNDHNKTWKLPQVLAVVRDLPRLGQLNLPGHNFSIADVPK